MEEHLRSRVRERDGGDGKARDEPALRIVEFCASTFDLSGAVLIGRSSARLRLE